MISHELENEIIWKRSLSHLEKRLDLLCQWLFSCRGWLLIHQSGDSGLYFFIKFPTLWLRGQFFFYDGGKLCHFDIPFFDTLLALVFRFFDAHAVGQSRYFVAELAANLWLEWVWAQHHLLDLGPPVLDLLFWLSHVVLKVDGWTTK